MTTKPYRTEDESADPNEHTKAEFASGLLCEFLEVAIHQILHARDVYPPQIFTRRKKYHIPVYMSSNAQVNKYITSVLLSLKAPLKAKAIKQVVVNIKQQDRITEKFVFELNHLSMICDLHDELLINLEQSLRAMLLKLATCATTLKPTSSSSDADDKNSRTFEVLVSMQGHTAIDVMNDGTSEPKWVKAQLDISDQSQEKITPLKSVTDSPLVQMQLYYVRNPKQVL